MEIHPLLVQFGGSLAAILALYVLARALGLGASKGLRNEDDVRDAADEVESGFDAERIAIDRKGQSALARDGTGRILIIKRHGNQFAGRILCSTASVREEVDAIIVDPGEARFGKVRLVIDNPGSWVDAINRL